MNRFNEILHSINDIVSSGAGEMYGGKKRSDLKDSDFLFPQSRSFPIVTPQDIPDAISNFGRMKGQMDYKTFLRKLYNMAKRKGPSFVAALPDASKEQLGLNKKTKAACKTKAGDKIKNINTACIHYGSEGIVQGYEALPDNMGDVVVYTTTNAGPNWTAGQTLKKTESQLWNMNCDNETQVSIDNMDNYITQSENNSENETPEMELEEYKDDFYGMSLGSIKSIATHAQAILNTLDDPQVKENLTEPFLQGRIAITEDYMRTIHDYVMFSESEADDNSADAKKKKESKMPPFAPPSIPSTPSGGPSVAPAVPAAVTEVKKEKKKPKHISIDSLPKYQYVNTNSNNGELDNMQTTPQENQTLSGDKPGLWDNIRKKKQKEGKNYRPARPGEKDRPDPQQWKKLTK